MKMVSDFASGSGGARDPSGAQPLKQNANANDNDGVDDKK